MKTYLYLLCICIVISATPFHLVGAQEEASSTEATSAAKEEGHQRNSIAVAALPFIFPGILYLDSRLQYEHSFTKEISTLVGLTYKRTSSPDSRIRYSDYAIGPNAYLKYYAQGFFVNGGLEYLKVHVTNHSQNTSTDGWTTVLRAVAGKRISLPSSLFFEYGGGLSYYFNKVQSINAGGYKRGILPSIHLALGVQI